MYKKIMQLFKMYKGNWSNAQSPNPKLWPKSKVVCVYSVCGPSAHLPFSHSKVIN